MEVPGKTTFRPRYEPLEWDGQVYDAHEAAPALLRVVIDPDTVALERVAALNALTRLRDGAVTKQLISFYDGITQQREKLGVIRCLISSQDPKAFRLFSRLLEQDGDKMIRMFGAVGLAQWNVRGGVAELIELLTESCNQDGGSARTVCNEAAKELLWLNEHKGWGFQEKETREQIEAKTDLAEDAKASRFVDALVAWFTENKHRFPEWKPGDPLPAIPERKPGRSGKP